jgi:hypothetical protein
LYVFHAIQTPTEVTAREANPTARPIPAQSPVDNPPPLELDGLLVELDEGNDVVVDADVMGGEIVVDVAASGFPHCVGMYCLCVVVGSIDGSIGPFASLVGSIMKKVEESDVVASEVLQEIGSVRSVFSHCQRSLYPQ